MINYEHRNAKLLGSFVTFCCENPKLRFWQALRAWAGVNFIFVSKRPLWMEQEGELRDTFDWEGRDA